MHSWNLSIKEAIELQKKLSKKIICKGKPGIINYIAGADIAFDKMSNYGFCAIIIFSYPNLEVIEKKFYYDKITFPYVSGLLSFREGLLLIETFKQLNICPDIMIFDGQGIAHPRRLGIASHIGLILNIPSIGCAKSRLYGNYQEPSPHKGAKSYLYDNNSESIGIVLRTKNNVKPVFISPGHLIGIEESAAIAIKCVTKYRIPEPTRVADIEVAEYKKSMLKIIQKI